MTANTWYSYDYSADNDLKDSEIISLVAKTYDTNTFGVFQMGLNATAKKIWYGTTVSTTGSGSVIRVAYLP